VDVFTVISYFTELLNRFLGRAEEKPRLVISFQKFHPDFKGGRLVFRAAVTNKGKGTAKNCEGFWAVFDSHLNELEASTSVFWSPLTDDDYNFRDRTSKLRTLDYNERAFCWVELSLNYVELEGKKHYFFPIESSPGKYYVVLIYEYGQFKSFNLLQFDIKERILHNDNPEVFQDRIQLNWSASKGFKGFRLRRSLARVINATDYHEHIRPT
jgi:hypothetical protein